MRQAGSAPSVASYYDGECRRRPDHDPTSPALGGRTQQSVLSPCSPGTAGRPHTRKSQEKSFPELFRRHIFRAASGSNRDPGWHRSHDDGAPVGSGAVERSVRADGVQRKGDGDASGRIRASVDRVGPLRLSVPGGALPAACPGAEFSPASAACLASGRACGANTSTNDRLCCPGTVCGWGNVSARLHDQRHVLPERRDEPGELVPVVPPRLVTSVMDTQVDTGRFLGSMTSRRDRTA